MKYVVEFERVGRNRNVPNLEYEGSIEGLVDEVLTYVGRFLASKEFDISVDPESGEGWIEAGRFGRFKVQGQ